MPDNPLIPVTPNQRQQAQKQFKRIQKGQRPFAGFSGVQGIPGSPCLVSWPSKSFPIVGTVGGGCLLSKTNVRAWVGGLMLAAAGVTGFAATAILTAAVFRKSGLAGKAADVASIVPGGQGVGAALRSLDKGSAAPSARHVGRRRREQAREERSAERRLGEPRENTNLRVGRGAIRETPAGTRRRRAEAQAANDKPPF